MRANTELFRVDGYVSERHILFKYQRGPGAQGRHPATDLALMLAKPSFPEMVAKKIHYFFHLENRRLPRIDKGAHARNLKMVNTNC
ncbi:hypothetical protein D3C73_1531440 [compost metagenome]